MPSFFALNQGSKSAKTDCDICAMYEEGAMAETTVRNCNQIQKWKF